MTIQTLYSCDKCEFEFQDSSGIFWVDVDGYLHVDALNEVSSHEASQSLLSGGVYQYYCYNCENVILKFDIRKIEELSLKMEKVFVVDKNDEFLVDDSIFNYDALDKVSNKFWGKYYGYYCRDCSKQINKFVIVENSDNLSDDEIKSVLHDHTNDLTVFINNPGDICPNCGNKIQILKEFSPCPNCGEGKLRIKDIN